MANEKHAMLITVYNDFEVLIKLLKYYSEHFDCYVHIDKKVSIPGWFLQEIREIENITIMQTYKINWGSYCHVLAVLELLKCASCKGYSYYHILSGNTYPLQSAEKIKDYFKNAEGTCYIEMFPTEGNEECDRRQRFFYFLHLYDIRSEKGARLERRIIRLQERLRIKRKKEYQYKGYFYCHLPHDFIEICLQWLQKNPWYIKKISTVAISEEFFFQNIIARTNYLEKVCNNCLIYSRWRDGDKGPAVLDIQGCQEAINSGALFARKIRDVHTADWILENIRHS